MSEREKVLRAQLTLSVIILNAWTACLLFIQDSFTLFPLAVAACFVSYRFGRLDEYRDSIKINS